LESGSRIYGAGIGVGDYAYGQELRGREQDEGVGLGFKNAGGGRRFEPGGRRFIHDICRLWEGCFEDMTRRVHLGRVASSSAMIAASVSLYAGRCGRRLTAVLTRAARVPSSSVKVEND
jgi:hypothetical protein